MEKYKIFVDFARSVYVEFESTDDSGVLHSLIRNYNESTGCGFHVHKSVFNKFIEYTNCPVYTYNAGELLIRPNSRIALDTFFCAPYYIDGNVLKSSDGDAHMMICICGGLDDYLASIQKNF